MFNQMKSSVNLSDELMERVGVNNIMKKNILEIIGKTEIILNKNKLSKKIFIEIDGKQKEIEKLKVDSNGWEVKIIGGLIVKINPEGDIVEYLEGILEGEQLLTWEAAKRETEKKGLRLLNDKEYQIIFNKFGLDDFVKVLPGIYDKKGQKFLKISCNIFLWTKFESSENNRHNIAFIPGNSKIIFCGKYKNVGVSVFGIKE